VTTTYTPGVCNIGPAERRKRRLGGYLGLVITVLSLAAFVIFGVPDPWRVLIAMPVGLGANGFLQSAMHFCVGFSMRGLYNMGTALGTEETGPADAPRRSTQGTDDRRLLGAHRGGRRRHRCASAIARYAESSRSGTTRERMCAEPNCASLCL
jgi:hypothetical protein